MSFSCTLETKIKQCNQTRRKYNELSTLYRIVRELNDLMSPFTWIYYRAIREIVIASNTKRYIKTSLLFEQGFFKIFIFGRLLTFINEKRSKIPGTKFKVSVASFRFWSQLDKFNFQTTVSRLDGVKMVICCSVHEMLRFILCLTYDQLRFQLISSIHCTEQKMKFSIKDFFSKSDQIRSFLRIWSHLLNKSLMGNFIFYAV